MSQLSPEVIIDDFSKLKEIFNNQEEEIIWKIFSEKLFNFNHTLELLLEKNISNISDPKNKSTVKFNIMEKLGNIFQSKNKDYPDNSSDYQRLD